MLNLLIAASRLSSVLVLGLASILLPLHTPVFPSYTLTIPLPSFAFTVEFVTVDQELKLLPLVFFFLPQVLARLPLFFRMVVMILFSFFLSVFACPRRLSYRELAGPRSFGAPRVPLTSGPWRASPPLEWLPLMAEGFH